MKEATPLREVLREFMESSGVGAETVGDLIKVYWADAVGEQIARATDVTSVVDGIVNVRTESPAWANELKYQTVEILSRLNARLGKEAVTQLRVRIGAIRIARKSRPKSAGIPPSAVLARFVLTDEEERHVNDSVEQIVDQELRSTIGRIMTNQLKTDRWRGQNGFRKCARCGVYHKFNRDLCPSCWPQRPRAVQT